MRRAAPLNWEQKAIPCAGAKALASSAAVPSTLVSTSCNAIRRTACLDSAPDHFLLQKVSKILSDSELQRYFSASNVVMQQKNEIGIDPVASTAFLAGERLQGYPGYGEAGSRAQVYYELACNSAHMLSRNV